MSDDESMDARLRAAGERWRAATPAATAESGASEFEPLPEPAPRRRTWIASAAAAAIVAAVGVGVGIFASGSGHQPVASGQRALPNQPVGSQSALQGVTWVSRATGVQVVFLADAVRLDDGCTNGLRSLQVNGDQLSIGAAFGPQMTCGGGGAPAAPPTPDPRAVAAAQRFEQLLHGTSTWAVTGHTLTLSRAGVGSTTLTTNGKQAPTILGGNWVLTQYNDSAGRTHNIVDPGYNGVTFDVTSAGQLTASGFCGGLTGLVTVSDVSIDLSGTGALNPAQRCAFPQPGSADRVLPSLLSGTVWYSIRGDDLIISKQGQPGNLVYTFIPQSQTTQSPPTVPAVTTSPVSTIPPVAPPPYGTWKLSNGDVYLTLQDTQYRIDFRCEQVIGRTDYANTSITFGAPEDTPHSCPPSLNQQAEARQTALVKATLSGQTMSSANDGTLTISNGNRTLVFVRQG